MTHARALLLMCGATGMWLGCNLILGNEAATFAPLREAGDDGIGSVGDADNDAPPPCLRSDLATNPRHCGACNHDCQGGECADGGCQAVFIAQVADRPTAFAVDGTHLYWTTTADDTIRRVSLDGGDASVPEVLYTNANVIWGDVIGVVDSDVVFG